MDFDKAELLGKTFIRASKIYGMSLEEAFETLLMLLKSYMSYAMEAADGRTNAVVSEITRKYSKEADSE